MTFIPQNMPTPMNPGQQMPAGPQMPGQPGVGQPAPAGFDTPDFTPEAGKPLPGMPGRETGLGGKQCGPAKDLESLRALLDSQTIKPKIELSECGDVDINIHSEVEMICPDFIKDFHKNIGTQIKSRFNTTLCRFCSSYIGAYRNIHTYVAGDTRKNCPNYKTNRNINP